MATYTVKKKQNIWDVAIELYGSIEGVFDLLISNKNLTIDTDLKEGAELEYHDYFILKEAVVSEIKKQGYSVANGERNVVSDLSLAKGRKIATSSILDFSGDNQSVKIAWKTNASMTVTISTDASNAVQYECTSIGDEAEAIIKRDAERSWSKMDIYIDGEADFDTLSITQDSISMSFYLLDNIRCANLNLYGLKECRFIPMVANTKNIVDEVGDGVWRDYNMKPYISLAELDSLTIGGVYDRNLFDYLTELDANYGTRKAMILSVLYTGTDYKNRIDNLARQIKNNHPEDNWVFIFNGTNIL